MSDTSGNPLTKTSVILYIAFFLVWCIGAAVGEIWPGAAQPSLWGMPLWFVIGCLVSFAGVSLALIHKVRTWLQ